MFVLGPTSYELPADTIREDKLVCELSHFTAFQLKATKCVGMQEANTGVRTVYLRTHRIINILFISLVKSLSYQFLESEHLLYRVINSRRMSTINDNNDYNIQTSISSIHSFK